GYMRMSIEYNNDNSKIKIQQAIGKVEKDMKIFPSVIRRAIDEASGNFSVEFGIDDDCARDNGDFCEAVLKELGIGHCSI
ncbi:MAG: hypothetical protein U9R16_03560, partial [Campylobacterota bacterium]|nr:hypothetical protein [Campylobacterota bacterium]